MSTVTIEVEEYEVDLEKGTFLVEFSITADMTYQPAKVSGPPEDCYPDESEIDVTEVKILSVKDAEGKEISLTPKLIKQLGEAIDPSDFYYDLWEEWEGEQDPPDSSE